MLKEIFKKLISSNRKNNVDLSSNLEEVNAFAQQEAAANSGDADVDLFATPPHCAIEFSSEKPVLFDIPVPSGRNKPYRKTGYLRRRRHDGRDHPTVIC